MYIGFIGECGFYYLVWEIVDNLIDEVLGGYVDEIIIEILKGEVICVIDNGCGILVDIYFKIKRLVVEIILIMFYVGGKFDKGFYKVFGGLYGVGVFVVNGLFEWFVVEIYKDGMIYE